MSSRNLNLVTWLLASVFLSPTVVGQRTWVVDLSGSAGSDYREVQPAIDASSAGDLILVRPGQGFYQGFTINKGVAIVCELRGWSIPVLTDITIRDLLPRERASLKRFTGRNSASIRIENNAGTVVVEKCQHGFQLGNLRILNSNRVILNEVVAIDARIESSFVTINRGISDASFVQDPLLWVSRSIVVFGNSVLVGSRANYDGIRCQVIFPPGDAIGGHDSVLYLGAGTTLRAGTLAVSGGSCPPIFIQAATISGQNITVVRDPATTLVGPTRGSVSMTTQPYPTLDGIVADEVNGRMDFDLIGTSGSATALIASIPSDPILTPLGIQWANLSAYIVTDVNVIDPTGHRRTSMTLPLAYPLGQPMVFQSIVLDPAGLRWSTPSVIIRN